ncbi:hypothetical protein [Thermaurantiacus sp.]
MTPKRDSGNLLTEKVRKLGHGLMVATFLLHLLFEFGMLPLWPAALAAISVPGLALWLVHRLGPAPSIYLAFPRGYSVLLIFLGMFAIMGPAGKPGWWPPVLLFYVLAWLVMIRPWRKGVFSRPAGARARDDPGDAGDAIIAQEESRGDVGHHGGGGGFGGGGASGSGWGEAVGSGGAGGDGGGDGGDGGGGD